MNGMGMGRLSSCASAIGKRVKAEFIKKYGKTPDKTSREVSGAIRKCNVYKIDELEWIQQIIKDYITDKGL
jgi:hypothetical protein